MPLVVKTLPMLGLEAWISGVGSDNSTNWATHNYYPKGFVPVKWSDKTVVRVGKVFTTSPYFRSSTNNIHSNATKKIFYPRFKKSQKVTIFSTSAHFRNFFYCAGCNSKKEKVISHCMTRLRWRTTNSPKFHLVECSQKQIRQTVVGKMLVGQKIR